tara:strand:- start:1 stop:117 length:117 start_codon:yes stop_codon:yes gene_type:complete
MGLVVEQLVAVEAADLVEVQLVAEAMGLVVVWFEAGQE